MRTREAFLSLRDQGLSGLWRKRNRIGDKDGDAAFCYKNERLWSSAEGLAVGTLSRAVKIRQEGVSSRRTTLPCESVDVEVAEMGRKLRSEWFSEGQIEAVKGFGRRFRMTMRSGVIRRNIYETEDAGHGYIYSPSYLIKDIECIADDMAEKGMEVYVSVDETGVEVAGLYPGTWDGEFESWELENGTGEE